MAHWRQVVLIVLQIVLQLGLNTNDLKLITAVIVAVFLALPYWKSKIPLRNNSAIIADGGDENA